VSWSASSDRPGIASATHSSSTFPNRYDLHDQIETFLGP
jgi:hypothetical protein